MAVERLQTYELKTHSSLKRTACQWGFGHARACTAHLLGKSRAHLADARISRQLLAMHCVHRLQGGHVPLAALHAPVRVAAPHTEPPHVKAALTTAVPLASTVLVATACSGAANMCSVR